MFNIGEGSLAIPTTWHNASVNIFSTSSHGGLSVTVARDLLGPGLTLREYADTQYASLAGQLARLSLLGQENWEQPPGYFYEITWLSPQQGLIHQCLLTTAQGSRVLNFSLTQTGMMNDEQRRLGLALLASFRFNP